MEVCFVRIKVSFVTALMLVNTSCLCVCVGVCVWESVVFISIRVCVCVQTHTHTVYDPCNILYLLFNACLYIISTSPSVTISIVHSKLKENALTLHDLLNMVCHKINHYLFDGVLSELRSEFVGLHCPR